MSEQPYMQLWIADFIGDTLHLTDAEIGQYLLLLMAMWRAGGSLPDDSKTLARITRNRVSHRVMAFFTSEDGKLSQKRLTKELARARFHSATQRANANARWNANRLKNNDRPDATALPADIPNGCLHNHNHIKERKQKESASERSLLLEGEFTGAFWKSYPNKVGKPKALAAYIRARKKASMQDILAGLERYIASKPPDRPWLNPATFLNQERFNDQPAAVEPKPTVAAAGARKNGSGWYISHESAEFDAWRRHANKHNDGNLIYRLKAAETAKGEALMPDRWPPR